MSSGADWLAKRLGAQTSPPATPAQSGPVRPPVTMPVQGGVPRPFSPGAPQQPALPQDANGMVTAGDAIKVWRGGAGNRDASTCPSCGSGNYFSRRNANVNAAPHCYDCGFPIIQYGSPSGEGGSQL